MSEHLVEGANETVPPQAADTPNTGRLESAFVISATETLAPTLEIMLASATSLADEIAARPNRGDTSLPREDLSRLEALGLLRAPLPVGEGGFGLGTSPAEHLHLLRLLAILGGADLVLGRLYEGHVNAIILITTFGTVAQLARAAQDCKVGRWFGVWNTGRPDPLRIELGPSNGRPTFVLKGSKTFASGASFVQRPIVTAEMEGGDWQMTLPRMEANEIASAVSFDRSFWKPLGMAASESYSVDLTGAILHQDDLIGSPGDFYRDPLFYGGAIRFAAVQAGALLRLHKLFTGLLEKSSDGVDPKSKDPYQVARLGEVAIGAQEAVLWVEHAAAVAAECLELPSSKLQTERMHEAADMTRLAMERIANAMLPRIISGVGAHGLLQPSPFERIIRNLTMYLRQPAPDHTLAAVGRASLDKFRLRAKGPGDGFWRESKPEGSLPPSYFERIYQRSLDPWDFQTSAYEDGKYNITLASLPRARYRNALEVGCSIGVLTSRLAERAESLLSVDVSNVALDAARKRCATLPWVRFARMQIPSDQPTGMFDLILVSEVAYYWQREDLDRAIEMLAAHQAAASHLLLVHYTKPVPDYPLTGDEVHETWLKRSEWRHIKHLREDDYRLDLLERTAEML